MLYGYEEYTCLVALRFRDAVCSGDLELNKKKIKIKKKKKKKKKKLIFIRIRICIYDKYFILNIEYRYSNRKT